MNKELITLFITILFILSCTYKPKTIKEPNSDRYDKLVNCINKISLNETTKKKIISMIRPAVGVKTESIQDDLIPIGKSKIGGQPDLPKGVDWPSEMDKPLGFIAQYNLADLSDYDKENILPSNGLFYIFINPDIKSGGWSFRFIYTESKKLTRNNYTAHLNKNKQFKSAKIDFFESYTIPDYENYRITELFEEQNYDYDDIINCSWAATNYIDEFSYNNHQLIGHHRPIQYSVVYDLAKEDLGLEYLNAEEHRKKWPEILELSKSYEILLQIDCSELHTDLSRIGGGGTFYIGIKREDLRKHKFDNIKIAYQST